MTAKSSIFLLLFILLSGIAISQKKIVITNNLSIAREVAVVEIPWKKIIQAYPSVDTANLKIVNAATKQEVPHQLEYRGKKDVQNILVQLNVPPNAAVQLFLMKGKLKKIQTKTYSRFVPERKDDFAWENDRIAFRMYGKALENYPAEMAYGVDVWAKRTTDMVINKRYKGDQYHIDNGDGLDYYHVGKTLGAGGIAPILGDSIYYSKNFYNWKILDNGPLRSTFQLLYETWDVAGTRVQCIKTISLDAGSQLNKTDVEYTWENGNNLPVAVGIVKRAEPGEILLNEVDGLMAYWEPQHGADGTTGVACIFTSGIKGMYVNKVQILANTFVDKNSKKFTYYNGAVWDKAKKITGSEQWFQYLKSFKTFLAHPMTVDIQ